LADARPDPYRRRDRGDVGLAGRTRGVEGQRADAVVETLRGERRVSLADLRAGIDAETRAIAIDPTASRYLIRSDLLPPRRCRVPWGSIRRRAPTGCAAPAPTW
jgi:hypothetical protein